MLKRLRREFIAIVMVLVGIVLVAVLGFSFYGTYRTQRSLVDDSLRMSLSNPYGRFASGAMQDDLADEFWDRFDTEDGDDWLDEQDDWFGERLLPGEGRGGLSGLFMLINDQGVIIESNNVPVNMDSDTILSVISSVLVRGEAEGYDASLHAAWLSEKTDAGTRLAIVDTTSVDTVLTEQGRTSLIIIACTLLAFFGISSVLASWALRPVEAAWEQQRRFVSDASHELKTPLDVILANIQILQREEGLSDDARRWVDSTADEANQMKELVNDLLQLARSDESAAGTMSMRSEDFDLSEMVEVACLEFDAVAFEHECLLDTQVTEGIHLTGDPDWMERLVRILIDNACKYGEAGTTITVCLARDGSHSRLSVTNMGNPIDPEDLPHVFERFYRSDKARTRSGEGGFGLGLAIAKGIAEAHGGSIAVTSTAEDGTTFTVTL